MASVTERFLSGPPNQLGLIWRAFRGILDKMAGRGCCECPGLFLDQNADLRLGQAAPRRGLTAPHRVRARPESEQQDG